MSTLVAEIAEKIQLLSSAEKNDVLRLLLLDIDGAVDPDADEAWREGDRARRESHPQRRSGDQGNCRKEWRE